MIAIVEPGCDPFPAPVARLHGEAPRLVYVGRLVRTKRPGDAVAAFDIIRRDFPGAHLDLLGDGYLRPDLERAAPPGATVHGFVSEEEKARLVSAADLMLLPGTREGWGIVAIEAATAGVPAVAYDIPGLRDAVVDGQTGLLTRPLPAAMAAAAIALLRDHDRLRRLGEAARVRGHEFGWTRASDRLLAAITSGAGDGQGTP